MVQISRVLLPETLEQALAWLADPGLNALPLAGGTGIALAGARRAETLVDVTRLALDGVEDTGDAVVLGATLRVQQLHELDAVRGIAGGVLNAAAGHVGSRLIRNAATVAGALVHVGPWSDLPVAFLVVDAEVAIAGPSPRTIGVAELLERHPTKVLRPGELIVSVRVPRIPGPSGGAFHKLARTAVDDALVSVAARVDLGPDGACAAVRVALGAARPVPLRIPAAEQILAGREPSAERIAEAARAARDAVEPRKDRRASQGYREEMIEVLVRRVLTESVRVARGGETP